MRPSPVQPRLDDVGERVAERAGAAELHVAVRVLVPHLARGCLEDRNLCARFGPPGMSPTEEILTVRIYNRQYFLGPKKSSGESKSRGGIKTPSALWTPSETATRHRPIRARQASTSWRPAGAQLSAGASPQGPRDLDTQGDTTRYQQRETVSCLPKPAAHLDELLDVEGLAAGRRAIKCRCQSKRAQRYIR